jgi:hypothetical protein
VIGVGATSAGEGGGAAHTVGALGFASRSTRVSRAASGKEICGVDSDRGCEAGVAEGACAGWWWVRGVEATSAGERAGAGRACSRHVRDEANSEEGAFAGLLVDQPNRQLGHARSGRNNDHHVPITIEEEGLWTRTRQSVAQNEVGEARTCAL